MSDLAVQESTREALPSHLMPEDMAPASMDPMVAMIERIAMNPDLPIERMVAVMDMRQRQMDKEAEQTFNRAFAAAMAEMPDVKRTGKNNHTGNKYATLDDLIRTSRPVLARHGLSLNWQTHQEDNTFHVTAIVRHADGHQIETTLSGQRDSGKQMNTLQGGGSTETYLKRYTGFSILGLSAGDEVDDDGRGSGEPISEDQFVELQGLINDAEITDDVVCAAEKLASLHELPASKFAHVRNQLQTTIKNKKAAA